MDVFISNEIISSSISHEALSVYLAVSGMSKANCSEVLFNVGQIEYVLCGSFCLSARKKNSIKQAISELYICGLLNIITHEKGEYVVKNNFAVTSKFTVVPISEIRIIMNIGGKVDKFSMIRYWLFLVSTMNSDGNSPNYGCGWWTINSMANELNIHRNSVLTYNSILEECGLLYVYRPDATFVIGDSITRSNNTYGRLCNKNSVIKCGVDYFNKLASMSDNKVSTIQAVDGRNVSARYNHFIKGLSDGKVYDIDFVKKLNYDCEMYNENYKNVVDIKLKDLTIFDEYLRGDSYGA